MNEKPLERLNYYNGQRLEAADLKLEQDYHIRVRRWLNRSLYKPGIASGLGVRSEGDATVVVAPGLALDAEGREMILLEEARIDIPGVHGKGEDGVEGLFLTIQYREQTVEEQVDGCTVVGNKRTQNRLAWGGPGRLRADPILGWTDYIPHESSGKIILARVKLDKDCKIESVLSDVRHYVGDASASKVHQYALEGVRDIDSNNPARIYFHIRGRQPNAVTLYLRAEKFSTLYYTEMGQHSHSLTAGTMGTAVPPLSEDNSDHAHELGGVRTQVDGTHDDHELLVTFAGAHSYESGYRLVVATSLGLSLGLGVAAATIVVPVGAGEPVYNNNILPVLSATDNSFVAKITGGSHKHEFGSDAATKKKYISYDHTHKVISDGSIGDAGVTDMTARSGQREKALAYVKELQVSIGKDNGQATNYTDEIVDQLKSAHPTQTWDKLGDGSSNHAFVTNGTGEIKLDFLPNLDFDQGEYFIELSVAQGGGRILYNLYVE